MEGPSCLSAFHASIIIISQPLLLILSLSISLSLSLSRKKRVLMGSSSSRLGSRPSRSPRANRFRRTVSSLLPCGGSTSHAPTLEMDDDPAELLVNSAKHNDPVVNFQNPTKDSALTSGTDTGFTSPKAGIGDSSESSTAVSEDSSSDDGSNQRKCLSESKELVPPHLINADYRHSDTASTSYEDWSSSDPVSANGKANMDIVDGVHNLLNKDMSRIHSEVIDPISSSLQEPGDSPSDGVSVENHSSELMAVQNSESGSGPSVSDSQVAFHSLRNDTLQEAMPSGLGFLVSDREGLQRGGSVLHVDVVSISSNILSSNTAEISSREARRNSRRLFWDAFSRRSSRRHSDSRTFLFSTDDTDDLGSHDRWLLDFSGDFFDDGFGGDSGHLGRGTHSLNERRWHSRSEIWERLRGSLNGSDRRTSVCPSGLHTDGTCSCEAEESSTHASISRIVMLAEALFEVLDEIHRQPVSLALSMLSLPAVESVVDSLPVKYHRKPDTTESGDDVAQCYICLAEYEEGDKIRVLPCHHEYHMSCVDKWLKEIHGVCPLCRGDVSEGFTEGSVSNPEVLSL
ncbi:hypothetical protein F0562_030278 [Nyssa sinensis]|uniref:RING-type domain-containing protein n=1 Tax=Nyssa sinensis TaxID=561372 RepID=A0A5J5AVZ4_9ASTE|nr:hypothetical protein F0562_030278 [Nyssa sinensis]